MTRYACTCLKFAPLVLVVTCGKVHIANDPHSRTVAFLFPQQHKSPETSALVHCVALLPQTTLLRSACENRLLASLPTARSKLLTPLKKMTLLREWLLVPLSPLWNNISCTLLILAYVKIAMEGAAWIRLHLNRKSESQQVVHIAISSIAMFWPLYDKTDWSWRLNVLVPAALSSRLLFKVRTHTHMSYIDK